MTFYREINFLYEKLDSSIESNGIDRGNHIRATTDFFNLLAKIFSVHHFFNHLANPPSIHFVNDRDSETLHRQKLIPNQIFGSEKTVLRFAISVFSGLDFSLKNFYLKSGSVFRG